MRQRRPSQVICLISPSMDSNPAEHQRRRRYDREMAEQSARAMDQVTADGRGEMRREQRQGDEGWEDCFL
jgi:hypothetical protein